SAGSWSGTRSWIACALRARCRLRAPAAPRTVLAPGLEPRRGPCYLAASFRIQGAPARRRTPIHHFDRTLASEEHFVATNGLPEIVIVSGARTPMAEWIGGKRGDGLPGGLLASVSAIDLGAIAAKAALERGGYDAKAIDHVVMGNAMQT